MGYLRENIDQWRDIGTSEYILKVIETGYVLPFKKEPGKVFLKNNKSAEENAEFVGEETSKLLEKGCVIEVSEAPHVVNSLTVAQNKAGKLRLVLDCKHIYPALFQFKYKYEDANLARTVFEKGDHMYDHIRFKICISSHQN